VHEGEWVWKVDYRRENERGGELEKRAWEERNEI
jgi:hypothetical protein